MPSWEDVTESWEGWTMYYEPMGKIRRFLFHWRNGREDHFPICCILRFSIECALMDGKSVPATKGGSAARRGSIKDYRRSSSTFVPCNIFHRSRKKHGI